MRNLKTVRYDFIVSRFSETDGI